jgi:hypothetical protein
MTQRKALAKFIQPFQTGAHAASTVAPHVEHGGTSFSKASSAASHTDTGIYVHSQHTRRCLIFMVPRDADGWSRSCPGIDPEFVISPVSAYRTLACVCSWLTSSSLTLPPSLPFMAPLTVCTSGSILSTDPT